MPRNDDHGTGPESADLWRTAGHIVIFLSRSPCSLCDVGDTPVAGIFFMQGDRFAGMPEHWLSYFSVKDVDAAVERGRRAGAVIKREPFDVPDIGRIAIIQSPAGSVAGWMTPEPMPESRKISQ